MIKKLLLAVTLCAALPALADDKMDSAGKMDQADKMADTAKMKGHKMAKSAKMKGHKMGKKMDKMGDEKMDSAK